MRITKFDIGAEIISIITRGMYPDPKDALREYVQNGVDANGTNLKIKIRQNSIVIQDDGIGMNRNILRKAVRMGVSDKTPSDDVGFMGIGIYSAFHLCDVLTIYSRGTNDRPNFIRMNFGEMKIILETQKIERRNHNIQSEDLMDLQSLMEKCIEISDKDEVENDDFPLRGTRVELTKLEKEFYSALSNFEEVNAYLQEVIPLHFNSDTFEYASVIENYIRQISIKHGQPFQLINLELQVDDKVENLFRPYGNRDFSKSEIPLAPYFFELKHENEFYGIAWGCLSSVRRKIDNRELRGFIIKKQGFTIGNRRRTVKWFPRGNTFFDRYSGEVIILNKNILPNAARNDIEFSIYRSAFYESLTNIAEKFDALGHKFQEESKSDDDLSKVSDDFKIIIGSYSESEEDTENLISKIVSLKKHSENVSNKIKRNSFSLTSKPKAESLLSEMKSFEDILQNRVKELVESKKDQTKSTSNTKSKTDIASGVKNLDIPNHNDENKVNYESLYDLLIDLEYEISEELQKAIEIIDEMFVQQVATTKSSYYQYLQKLKDEIQDE